MMKNKTKKSSQWNFQKEPCVELYFSSRYLYHLHKHVISIGRSARGGFCKKFIPHFINIYLNRISSLRGYYVYIYFYIRRTFRAKTAIFGPHIPVNIYVDSKYSTSKPLPIIPIIDVKIINEFAGLKKENRNFSWESESVF